MNDTMKNTKGNARGKRRMEAVVNLAAGVTGMIAASAAMADSSPKITLHKPTNEWIEGLPLANGISAAMLWGAPSRTVLSLNHVDFWRYDLGLDPLPDLSKLMAETRQLMMAGKVKEANDFFNQKVYGPLHNMPRQRVPQGFGYTDAFVPVGDIVMALDGQENVTGYKRTLDLEHGMASISYRVGDNEVREECFVPAQADVVILSISASKPISGQVYATRPEPGREAGTGLGNSAEGAAARAADYKWSAAAKDGKVQAEGIYSEGVESAVRAVLQLRAGGKVLASSVVKSASVTNTSDALKFEGATELRLLIAVDSGRLPHDPRALAEKKVNAALTAEIAAILREHVREHQVMFNRVELSLTDKPGESPADAEQLVSRAMQGQYDNEMAELVFQYGRYLMMSCNRAGRRPANLQGIWNQDQYAAWDADWHLDLNVEMNQWMCNPCNLDECNLPLFKQMEYFIPQGRMIARRM